MAIVNPYLDPNAHGKLNDSLCFRRYKDKVILQGLPVPKKTATVQQILQREKMVLARNAFKLLPGETREYLSKHSIRERMTPANIFNRAFMTDKLPSQISVIPMKKVIDMTLFEPVGVIPEHIKLTLINLGTTYDCGLWSKLNEKIGSEVPSEIGPNGAVTGDLQFDFVKFGNGLCYKIPTGGYNKDFVSYGLSPLFNEGIIEFWLKLMVPIVNGTPPYNDDFTPIAYTSGIPQNNIYFQFDYPTGLRFYYRDDSSSHVIVNTSINLDAGSVHHYALAWSKEKKLPGNKTLALFLDGTERESTDESLNDNTQGINLQILQRIYHDVEGYLEQLKTYPSVEYLQDILDNRNDEGFLMTKNYGYIYDNKNQYVFENEVPVQGTQIIKVTCVHSEPVKIPFRYPITVKWEDNNFMQHTSIIRLPELELEPEMEVLLYISTDFSAYWDPILWRLASTNIM